MGLAVRRMGRAAHCLQARQHAESDVKERAALEDQATVISRLDALLTAPVDGPASPVRAEIEQALTDGYATALQIEGRAWRLQRRITDMAAEATDGKARELSRLAKELESAEAELHGLRALLASVRSRTFAAEPV